MTVPSADHFAPSVVSPFCTRGHVVTEHMDRRLLWNLELALRGSGSERLRDKGTALAAYLHATCEHHWHDDPVCCEPRRDDCYPPLRQCIWCNTVEPLTTPDDRGTA